MHVPAELMECGTAVLYSSNTFPCGIIPKMRMIMIGFRYCSSMYEYCCTCTHGSKPFVYDIHHLLLYLMIDDSSE